MIAFTIGLIAVCVVGTLGWMSISLRRYRKQLQALPRTPIRDLVGGTRVRVIGTARRIDADVGGIYTGTPCLACSGWIAGGDANLSPPEDRVVPFRVEDDTGAVAISIAHVKLELSGIKVDLG